MDDFIQYVLSSPYGRTILGLGSLLVAVTTIVMFPKQVIHAIKAIRDFYLKHIWPRLPVCWKAARPVVITLAFLAALIGPVSYVVWQILYLSVTRVGQVSERSVFISLFYQETLILVIYSMLWAAAVHFWLMPRLFPKKDSR